MCIIIDSCCAHKIKPDIAEGQAIVRWLSEEAGAVVYSDQLYDEVENQIFRDFLEALLQAGRARRIRKATIEAEIECLPVGCKSNDAHVVALARVSGARLLFSDDKKLWDDFRNHQLIKKPRGKVYKSVRNNDLLNRTVCKK